TGFGLASVVRVMPVLLSAPGSSAISHDMPLLTASLCLMPAGVCMMLSAPVTARVVVRYGGRRGLMLGLALITCGNLVAVIGVSHLAALVAATGIAGLGIGSAYASIP